MSDPIEQRCTHIDSHGLACGAQPGQPCVTLKWVPIKGFHLDRYTDLQSMGELTKTEQKVVRFLSTAHNNESIANQLEISIETVKRHISNICAKLHMNTRLEIACWFYQMNYEPKR